MSNKDKKLKKPLNINMSFDDAMRQISNVKKSELSKIINKNNLMKK